MQLAMARGVDDRDEEAMIVREETFAQQVEPQRQGCKL